MLRYRGALRTHLQHLLPSAPQAELWCAVGILPEPAAAGAKIPQQLGGREVPLRVSSKLLEVSVTINRDS